MACSVTVAQEILVLLVKIRILASQPDFSRTRIQPALIRQGSLERNQGEEPITIKIKKGLCMKRIKTDLHRGGLLAVASTKEGDI